MGMQREEEWVVVAVTKEYADSLTAAKRSDLVACLGLFREEFMGTPRR